MPKKHKYQGDFRSRKNAILSALGLRSKGFFTQYDYLNSVSENTPVYTEVLDLMVAKQPSFREFINAISSNQNYFGAFGQGRPNPDWLSRWISPLDGAAIYTGITEFKPRRIVEVGSGNTTHFMVRAIVDHSMDTTVTCIDPSPRIDVSGLPVDLKRRVLSLDDLTLVKSLKENDILFIDSSHILQQGFDLDILLNRFLPALNPGVILHFHDIFLPYSYPEKWASFRFNEQNALIGWILSGYLDVLFSSHYVYSDMASDLQEATQAFPLVNGKSGGSIWLRKVGCNNI